MPEFFYKAIAAEGKVTEGSLLRDSERAVARELAGSGLTPVYVGTERRASGASFDPLSMFRSRPGAGDRLYFTQELATLLEAGLPLDRALPIAPELSEPPAFPPGIQEVLTHVKG